MIGSKLPRLFRFSDEWQLQCASCGRSRSFKGRVSAPFLTLGKGTIGWCRGCGSLRPLQVVPLKDDTGRAHLRDERVTVEV